MDNMDNMDIEEDDEISENNYREETIMIRKLDCKNVKCKQFLTRSFRKLNKLVNKKRNYTYKSIHIDSQNKIISLTLSSNMLKLSNLIHKFKCLNAGKLPLNLISISMLPIADAIEPKLLLMERLLLRIISMNLTIFLLNSKNLSSKMVLLI